MCLKSMYRQLVMSKCRASVSCTFYSRLLHNFLPYSESLFFRCNECVQAIEKLGSQSGKPSKTVTIADSGEIKE
jgi:hypothetical protein